jgi:hypothetical protein
LVRVDLQFDGATNAIDAFSKKKSCLLQRSKQIADHRKGASDGIGKKNGWTLVGVNATLHFGDFEMGR